MQVLVVVVGIGLIVAGLYFAIGGFGGAPAGGGARGIKLEGPAWLVLVAIGAALLVFPAFRDFSRRDDDGSSASQTTSSTVATTTTTTSSGVATNTTLRSCRRVVDDPEPPLNVRQGPDTSFESVGSLENGTEIVVVENGDGWLRIESPFSGWVFEDNTTCT